MGGTLPVLVSGFSRLDADLGSAIGALYAANTFGAVLGTFATGFFLVERAGLAATTRIAIAVNFVVALVALLLAGTRTSPASVEEAPPLPDARRRLVLAAFALSGFAGLAYELLGLRLLIFYIRFGYSNVYSYTTILVVFLVGIAAGSAVVARWSSRIERPLRLLGRLQAASALYIAATPAILPAALGPWRLFEGTSPTGKFVDAFLRAGIAILLPTLLMGAAFPLAARALSARGKAGADMGRAYAVNTLGGIAGAFCAGFVLIVLLGIVKSFLVTAAVMFLAALLVHAADEAPRRSIRLATAALVAFAGYALLGPRIPAIGGESRHIVYYREGASSTVIVRDLVDGSRSIQINDFSAAGTSYYAMRNQRMMGYLPLLVHRGEPSKALVICFGTGTTVGSLAQMPGLHVTSVEIDADVYRAAPFFERANHDAVNHPRVHKVVDDGRHFVAVSKDAFDVVTSEPLHPKRAGTVNLYSEDYYRAASKRLAPGGVLAQWLPLHAFERDEFRSIVRAFSSVFPFTYLWLGEQMILLGTYEKLELEWSKIAGRMAIPEIAADLTEVAFDDPHAFVAAFLAVEDDVRRYVEGAPTITDDLPTIEYSKTESSYDVYADLIRFRSDIRPWIVARDATFSEEKLAAHVRRADRLLESMSRLAAGDRAGARDAIERALAEHGDDRHLRRVLADLGGGLLLR